MNSNDLDQSIIDQEIGYASNLYKSWAYGDTYYFELQRIGDGGILEPAYLDGGANVCSGTFYGDHDESGLFDEIKSQVNQLVNENEASPSPE